MQHENTLLHYICGNFQISFRFIVDIRCLLRYHNSRLEDMGL